MSHTEDSLHYSLDIGARSDVGLVRDHNEDSMLSLPEIPLFAVADGMGGHSAGERASLIAVQTLREIGQAHANSGVLFDERRMESAFVEANTRIHDESMELRARHGMGTTMTAMALNGGDAIFGHVGDSRAWLIRGGQCTQITEDHSIMAEQVAAGILTEEQARVHPMRNVLTRSLGNHPEVPVDTQREAIMVGDIFVIGSDGMTGVLDADRIGAIVLKASDASAAARALVDYARDNDGSDNITAVVVACQSPSRE